MDEDEKENAIAAAAASVSEQERAPKRAYERKLKAHKLDLDSIYDALARECCKKLHCTSKFTAEQVHTNRQRFHNLPSATDRRAELVVTLETGRAATSGGFQFQGQEVCSTFLALAYGVSK